jgi:asparagine synthetase B (glutamine-hydrolysing)
MCTFKITNCHNDLEVDKYLRLGGPTLSQTIVLDNIHFTHHLLSITGKLTPQPVKSGDYYYMLLGEIYNYDKSLPSDIYYAIEMYEKHKEKFTNYLDGEFLIIVYDTKEKQIHFFTDPWSTRQAWFETWDDYFYFGTYPKNEIPNRLEFWNFKRFGNLERLLHNSHYVYDVKDNHLEQVNSELHKWNLDQFDNSYDTFKEKLEQAILKRYHEDSVTCLSGGLDSGAIALCLTDHKIPFTSITLNITKAEDCRSLSSVLAYTNDYNTSYVYTDYTEIKKYDILKQFNLQETAVAQMAQHASNLNKKVVIQANGFDEIFSNYSEDGKKGNKFFWPENLKEIFPWDHFYGGQNRRLIDRKELIFLIYGLEIRNIFLDKYLVQAWLNLSVELKNSTFKGGQIEYFLERNICLPTKVAGGSHQERKLGPPPSVWPPN